MRHAVWLALTGALMVSGCADPEADRRLTALEERVQTLEARPAGPGQKGEPAVDEVAEAAAGVLLRAANEAANENKYDVAKAALAELKQKYASTRTYRSSLRLAEDIELIGSPAGDLDVEKWFQGDASMNDGKATLIVFWELWCPHCQNEVPKLEQTWTKYGNQGLNMVALTKVSKNSTDEGVSEFLKEHKVTYPVGKETGAVSARYGIRGIPAAAVVKDGKVMWRGHPARLTDKMLEDWISG